MPYIPSPTACAEQAAEEIIAKCCAAKDVEVRKNDIKLLLRQLVRDVFEHCARDAENWVVYNDPEEMLDGMDVGDCIAAALRDQADERQQKETITKTIRPVA